MRQEHERINSKGAELLSGISAGDAVTRENTGMPITRAAGQKQDAETGALTALTMLTQTLVAPLPPRSALLRALSLGPQVLPCMRALSLYATPDGTRASLTLAGSVERRDDGTVLAAHDVWQARTTLGHGVELDRRALDDHTVRRVGGITAVPLYGPEVGPVGVLVVEEVETAHARERHPLLDVLAHCLSVLLERHLRTEVADRSARALSALGDLAASTTRGGTTPSAYTSTRDAVLSIAADALHELALPLASVALAFEPDGTLHGVGTASDTPVQLDPARSAQLLAALRGQVALPVTAGHTGGVWDDLAALREQVSAHTGKQVERMTLLPIWVEDKAAGVLVLSHARGGLDRQQWMPVAATIALAAGAELRASRLAETAAEEGRSRDEFISLAAHELRSPLTSIKGYAQLLTRQARKTALPDTMLRSVEAIQEQSLRMAEMVGELLDASRIRRGTLEVRLGATDLVPLTQKVIEKRQKLYPEHTAAVQIEAPSLVGEWDVQRLEQILSDLLDNAARYSPEGGVISIRLASVNGMALVSVRDEGIGIAPEDQERIFDYLYRAPSAQQRNLSGLGLGLYICRHLAERMGGQLALYETHTGEAHGSEFRLLLPLA